MSADGLREAIRKHREFPSFQSEFLPYTIIQTRKEISKKLGDVSIVEPTEYSLNESYNAIVAYYRSNQHLQSLKTKYVRHIPFLIFDNGKISDGSLRLESLPGFEAAYFERVKSKPLNSVVNSLLHRLVTEYPDITRHKQYYVFARRIVTETCTSFRCDQYLDINQRLHIFSVSGPSLVWSKFVEASGSLSNRILSLEFPSDIELEQTKFFDAVVEQGITDVRSSLKEKANSLPSMLEALMKVNFGDEGRYNYLRTKLIESLLLPFADEQPDVELRDQIKDFLFERYGDPRINFSGYWNGVSQEAIDVILSWLVEDALEDFFRLFSYVAETNEDIKRHWKYREAFWKAYLDKGFIDQAWVVLGHRMEKGAIDMLSLSAENYGKFVQTQGIQVNQAALIMKINGHVITEWNYNGKYRVWSRHQVGQGDAPLPYKKRYQSKQALMAKPAFESAHFGSDHYSWQKKLATYLNDKTGRRVDEKDFRITVKRRNRGRQRIRSGGIYG